MRRDEALERRGVLVDHREALRQLLQVLEAARPLGLLAERLAQRVGELRRRGGLEADQRLSGARVLQADLDTVGGMRVDDHAVLREHPADGGDAIGVRAAAPDELAARRQGDLAALLELAPQLLELRRTAKTRRKPPQV